MMGFALVFVLVVTALSLCMAIAVRCAGPSLRRRGAQVERQAVALAAGLPVALATALVATLVVAGYLGDDHCGVHDHHAHLCLAHGDAWGRQPWVVVVLAAAGATVLARLAVLIGQHGRAASAVARLREVGSTTGDVTLVDSARAFCFVAGLWRPRIYASTAAWSGLTDDERAAMLAHERGHITYHDLTRRLGLELLLALSAPFVTGILMPRWARATERLRDGDAARAVGDPEPVARAMVHLCRLELAATAPGFRFAASGDDLSDRVEALLANESSGRRAARVLALALVGAAVLVAMAVAVQADPLHHALETLLG